MNLAHRLAPLAIVATVAAGCGSPADATVSAAATRAELRGLIEDVTSATATRFGATDDQGRGMDTVKMDAAASEDGELIYFRLIPDGSAS